MYITNVSLVQISIGLLA